MFLRYSLNQDTSLLLCFIAPRYTAVSYEVTIVWTLSPTGRGLGQTLSVTVPQIFSQVAETYSSGVYSLNCVGKNCVALTQHVGAGTLSTTGLLH